MYAYCAMIMLCLAPASLFLLSVLALRQTIFWKSSASRWLPLGLSVVLWISFSNGGVTVVTYITTSQTSILLWPKALSSVLTTGLLKQQGDRSSSIESVVLGATEQFSCSFYSRLKNFYIFFLEPTIPCIVTNLQRSFFQLTPISPGSVHVEEINW